MPLFFLFAGLVCGKFFFSPQALGVLDAILTYALMLLVFTSGVGVGFERHIFSGMKKNRLMMVAIPLGTIAGTLLAGSVVGLLLGMPLNEAASVSAGFGYYSLSMGIFTDYGEQYLGALSFLINIFRELLALLLIPWLSKRFNGFCAVSCAGATSMDTALPMISRYNNELVVVMSVINGVLLSAAVPILVPLLYEYL